MARWIGYLIVSLISLIGLGLSAAAQTIDESPSENEAKNEAASDALSLTAACLNPDDGQAACEDALRFTPDFQARVTTALATNERLEMSAYDIGAVLGDQHDLITEFDALYRATSALVIRLVNLRLDDRAEINRLRTISAQAGQDLALSTQALALAQQELSLLQDKLAHTQALITVREGEIATLQAAIHAESSAQEDAHIQIKLDLQAAETQAQTLRDQLANANLRLSQLGEQLTREAAAYADLSSTLMREQADRLAADAALATAQEQITLLTAEITALSQEREGLVQTISDQATLIEELRAALKTITGESHDMADQLATLIAERDGLKTDLDQALSAQNQAEEKWQAALIEVELSRTAAQEAQAALAPLQSALDTSNQEIADLTQTLDQLRAEKADLMAQWDATQQELTQAQQLSMDQKQALADSEAQILTLEHDLGSAQTFIIELRDRLGFEGELSDAIEALQIEWANQTALIADLQVQLAAAKATEPTEDTEPTQPTEDTASLIAAEAEIDRLSAEVANLTGQIAAMTAEADRMQAAFNDLQALDAQQQAKRAGADAVAATIDDQLQIAQQEIADLRAENALLTREMTDMIAVSVEAQAAFDDLQARCDQEGSCAVIDDASAVDPNSILIEKENMEAQLRAALLELEMLKGQQYVRVERVAEWLTANMVGRDDQPAIEFEPRRFSLLQDLLFDTNSAVLNTAGEAELRRLAQILLQLEADPRVREQVLFAGYAAPVDWVLQIAGHADPRPISGGPFTDNWQLAAERALSVLRYLESQGVPANRLQSASYGDKKLVTGREGEDAINRRVSFTIGIR